MIATVTLNPAVDKSVMLPNFMVNEVNRVQSIRLDPGGKGINVSKVLHALGEETIVHGIVGGAAGAMIEQALREDGIPCMLTRSDYETRTNLKIVDPVCGTNTDINEGGHPVTEALLDDVWQKLKCTLKPRDAVVLAGKNPPGVPEDCLRVWVKELHAMGVTVAADTVGEPMKRILTEKPDVIKPNVEELSQLIGTKLLTQKELIRHISEVVNNGVGLAVVSMGGEGAVFCDGSQMLVGKPPKVTVQSTVGAGDSMMAAVVCGFQKKWPLEEIASYALAVSAAKVSCPGSAPPSLELVQTVLDQVSVKKL